MGKVLNTNARTYRTPTGMEVSLVVVLVEGSIGDYVAYAGACVDSEHVNERQMIEYVKRDGHKLSFVEACIHFPFGLEEGRYRR